MTMLDLCCCADFSVVVASGDCCLVAVFGLLLAVASLVSDNGL